MLNCKSLLLFWLCNFKMITGSFQQDLITVICRSEGNCICRKFSHCYRNTFKERRIVALFFFFLPPLIRVICLYLVPCGNSRVFLINRPASALGKCEIIKDGDNWIKCLFEGRPHGRIQTGKQGSPWRIKKDTCGLLNKQLWGPDSAPPNRWLLLPVHHEISAAQITARFSSSWCCKSESTMLRKQKHTEASD